MAIERASFGHAAWPRDWISQYAESFPHLFFVALIGDRVVGYCAAVLARGSAELVSIAVLPAFRGRGVARALLNHIVRRVRTENVLALWLMVRADNTRAQRLYSRFGFTRVRTVPAYYENRAPGLRLRLPL